MRGAIPPLPNTPLSHGAQLKKSTGTTSTFYLHLGRQYRYAHACISPRKKSKTYDIRLEAERNVGCGKSHEYRYIARKRKNIHKNENRGCKKTDKPKTNEVVYTRVCPKLSGLAAWSENCKWYGSLPLDAVVSLFYDSV
jgi:hypothetical protein